MSDFSKQSKKNFDEAIGYLTEDRVKFFARPYRSVDQLKADWYTPVVFCARTMLDLLKIIAQAGEILYIYITQGNVDVCFGEDLLCRIGSALCNFVNTFAAVFFAATRSLSTIANGGYQTPQAYFKQNVSDAINFISDFCNRPVQ